MLQKLNILKYKNGSLNDNIKQDNANYLDNP